VSVSLDLDPRFTFESYVVGTANRLAAAAARRVAETPGSAYNPLFLYSASGLGKTHLVTAIGHQVRRLHSGSAVLYDTLDNVVEGVMDDIAAGRRDALRGRLRDVAVLLLDDVQFLAGRRGVQEELLRAWDGLSARGGQIVLASDRAPTDIDGLDERLLSRFSGGLIVDLSAPDYETRVAIVLKKAEERKQALAAGVPELLARSAISNVRELQGRLNRVLAVQELDERTMSSDEVARLLGVSAEAVPTDEFAAFLHDIAGTVGAAVARVSPEQKLADAILRFGADGFRTQVLEAALQADVAEEVEPLIERYAAGVSRLTEVTAAIRELDPSAGELSRQDVLRNPERVDEAEALLEQVRYRMRPLPAPPSSPRFEELTLDDELLAVRAARAVAQRPGERYNPFFVHAPDGAGRTALVTALALLFREQHPDALIAFMTGAEFGAELIGAISSNGVDGWRARYRRARLLVIDGLDALADTERAQEELFHFFDGARRSGAQLVFTATCAPQHLEGLEERLRTRLESGLVVDLLPAAGEDGEQARLDVVEAGASQLLDEWFLDREKVAWQWPYVQDCVSQELA
jgi:chromosomal replication initiation ATPase DnaA